MKVPKLTEVLINSITIPVGERKIELRDQDIKGFILEMTAEGRGTYALRSRNKDGRQFCIKIGTRPGISLAEARAAATRLKAEIQLGADPHKDKRDQKAVPTLNQFVTGQYSQFIAQTKRSFKNDISRLKLYVLPTLGNRKMDTIQHKEIVDVHLAVRASGLSPATADRALTVLRHLYGLALQWGVITTNPTSNVKLFLENNEVHNVLDQQSLSRLLAVLQSYHNRPVAGLFLFLLSTGARLNEGLTASWEDVDMGQTTWRIPAVISKSKKIRAVPLNETALRVLGEQQPDISKRSGRVFVKANTGEPIKSVQRAWEKIREAAGLNPFRIHDLRHATAQLLLLGGRTLYEIQNILGHADPTVTQRYAKLSTKTLQEASASASSQLDAAMPRVTPPPDATSTPTSS